MEGNRLGTGTEQPFGWEAEQRLRPEASSSQENIPRAAGDLAHHPLPQTSFLPACLPQCQRQSAWPGAPSSVLEATANSKTFPDQCRLTILAWGILLLTCVCAGLSCSPRTYTPT